MTGKQLERYFERQSPLGATYLDHLGRALRAAGLMPTGGRGIGAPAMDATSVANFILGASVGGTPLSAAQAVPSYRVAGATWSGIGDKPDNIEPFGGNETLGEALEALLANRELAAELEAVEVVREWPRAIIRLKDGRRFFYGITGQAEAAAAGVRVTPYQTTVKLPASMFSALAMKMAEDAVIAATREEF